MRRARLALDWAGLAFWWEGLALSWARLALRSGRPMGGQQVARG